ncbi:c-type cytochrome [Luteolibacter pohnpeiensis]|uniref:C-type cytochrome n=1 Tax=Luteolibacter pohnpeiensis TaxID=454153 RepID=A0A934S4S9_9BACT|nr:c-type cytochrome [Luteolibacter pohnpeiensis]MBK1882272.1 c-type cytochrome [Luteolibacter pohnpeiensis]
MKSKFPTTSSFLSIGAATVGMGISCVDAVPEGFEIHEFAGPPNVEYPTGVSAAANGDLYISSDKNGSLGHRESFGKVLVAKDTDGDGKADAFKDFVPSVNSPRGGHFVHGTLYLIHPPYLTSYRDTDGDGVADQEKQLVKGFGWGIEHPRGADHTTNGVRMGIDGWLYVAVGDFGMPDAVGADGKHVTLQGGGVARIRPDGSELEIYASMTRNLYDLAISPYLDLFSRDNTNDGKGWNTRFHHFTELANFGYPRLYKNFADEAARSLDDYGGGSGTGGLYLHEPGFPGTFGDRVYTCDWTTGNVYDHPMTPDGATFVAKQEVFQTLPRALDIDVDGFSHLYLADWRNGGFDFAGPDAKIGMIQQVTAPGETPASYQDVTKVDDGELVKLLASRSGVQRMEAQREILQRGSKKSIASAVYTICKNQDLPLYGRVAAVFTYKQLLGAESAAGLVDLSHDATIREFALRALADRKSELENAPIELFAAALDDAAPRVRLQAAIGLARFPQARSKEFATPLLTATARWATDGVEDDGVQRLVHTGIKALVQIGNVDACLAAIDINSQREIALRALQEIGGETAVDGLILKLKNTTDNQVRLELINCLARLYHQEKPWDLESWWSTRPDDRGPYYEPVEWSATAKIKTAIEQNFGALPISLQNEAMQNLSKNRIKISDLNLGEVDPLVIALAAPRLDESQLGMLKDAALNPKLDWAKKLELYRAMERGPDHLVLPTKLIVLAHWSEQKDAPQSARDAVSDFINDTQRFGEVDVLKELAAGSQDRESTLAWKALLTVLKSPLSKQDAKQKVQKAIDSNPKEIGFFHAIAELGLVGFGPQIEAGLKSDNHQLIEAARAAQVSGNAKVASGGKVGDLPAGEVEKFALEHHGDAAEGKRLFTAQGCIACHATSMEEAQKGPYLGAAGSKFTRDYLIESILDPGKVVAQGFRTVVFNMKDGSTQMGFITGEADGVISLRDLTGQSSQIKRSDVREQSELTTSMMPQGLANQLTLDEFANLIEYLSSLTQKGG